MTDLGMYWGKNSIYSAMKNYASLVFPPRFKFEKTGDLVSNILLGVMMGVSVGQNGYYLRLFNKFVACNLLAEHLAGNTVSLDTAKRIKENNLIIFTVCDKKALPAHND